MLWRPSTVFSTFSKLASSNSDGSSTHRGVEGRSHRRILRCIIAGMRTCPIFLEHVFSLCLERSSQVRKRQEPQSLPPRSRESLRFGAFAAVPELSQGHEFPVETGVEESSSHPASCSLANRPAGSQASGGSLQSNFPAWKIS